MKKTINVIVEGGKATPGPPLGPSLGPLGVNAGKVVEEINKTTKDFSGMKVPVAVIIDTKSKMFEIEVGTPPLSELIKKEAKIEKGAGTKEPVGELSFEQIKKIADMCSDLSSSAKARVKQVVGACQSMGIKCNGKMPKELIKEIEEGKYDSVLT